jgi:uncharacterized protein
MATFFKIREEKVLIMGNKSPIRICHLSDLHFWFNDIKANEILKTVIDSNPEIIVLTGDYYDFRKGKKIFADFISKLSSKFPVYFISGNHDKLRGIKFLEQVAKSTSSFFLKNQSATFIAQNGVEIKFIPDQKNDFIKKKNQLNILLFHNPEKLKIDLLSEIDLILSGHLHGGQFIFWKSKSNSFYPASFLYKNCTDRKQIGNTTLIVSKGLGDTFPLRFNCPKEVLLLSIQ